MDDTIDHATLERLTALEERVTALESASGGVEEVEEDEEVVDTLPTEEPTPTPATKGRRRSGVEPTVEPTESTWESGSVS